MQLNLSDFKNKDAFAIILILSIVFIFYLPLLKDLNLAFANIDWYEKYCLMASFRNSVLEYHQFPLRSPYINGGYPTIGHPYDESFNPFSIITLIFGEIIGLRIIIFLIFIISSLGMFYLTRYALRYNLFGSFFSTATFMLSNWGACQIAEGNYEKLYFYFLPWLLAFFIKSKKSRKFTILSSLVLSIIIIKGVILISVLVFLFLFVCLHTIGRDGPRIRIDFSYLVIFLIVICLAFALCAPKILPTLQLFHHKLSFIHFPFEHSYSDISRHAAVTTGQALNLTRLYETLLSKDGYIVDGDDFFHMYLGYIPILLFLISSFIYWKKTFRLLVLLVIITIISFGSNSPIDLFKLLWHLHPFVHYVWKLDTAFGIHIFFLICLIAGSAFLLLDKARKHKRLYTYLAFIIIFISINNMFWSNRRFLPGQFSQKIPEFSYQEVPPLNFQKSFFQVQNRDHWKRKDDYFYLVQNVGVVNYHQNILIEVGSHAIPEYIVDEGDYRYIADPKGKLELNPLYRGEAFFLDDENQARMQYFSPNRIRIEIAVKNPGKLIINQNYHEAWRSNLGKLASYEGLLSLDLKERGAYQVILSYVPLDYYIGLIISLTSMACILLFLNFQRRPRIQ